MAQRFSKSPSWYWGFTDRKLIADFDRLHSLRLQLYENQIAKAQADAMKGETPDSAANIFTSGEGVKFAMPVGQLVDSVRSGREM